MNQSAPSSEQPDFPPERVEALEQAAQLQDESAAADFLLQCPWPDARLRAAELIRSRALLEHVLAAVRNSDRRVEKLLQQRLDAWSEHEAATSRGQAAVAHASMLVDAPHLLVNQVADLDREWAQVGPAPAEIVARFNVLREKLRQRLDDQAGLQQAVRELSNRLQQLVNDTQPSGRMLPPEQVAASLDTLESEMAHLCAAHEAPSLPKRVLADFRQKHEALHAALGTLEQRYAAVRAHEDALTAWEGQDPATLDAAAVRAQWQSLPPLAAADMPLLQERLDELLARLEGRRQVEAAGMDERRREARQHFSEAMDAFEAALRDGALHLAAEQDQKLRGMDLSVAHLRGDQKVRLQTARAELGRLQGWAKWGGKMSREELLKTAQDLPARSLPVADLAREVGSLRERWKALDATAGPASKDLWQRFDAACTTAYAPAAEHFKKQAQERHDNLERGRAMVEEVRKQADMLEQALQPGAGEQAAEAAAPDWKAIAGFCDRLQQQWRRLGPVDRKPKKTLDAEFAQALARLSKPLAERQAAEKQERVRLIEAVAAIDAAQRRAPEQLQELQQRWQQRARQLPLARHDEHALWQRFREACDQLFAKRKQHVKSADAERSAHLRERVAYCEKLEAAQKEKPEAIRALLREAKGAWSRLGPAPKSAERQVESRFHAALAALQKKLDEGERSARQQRADVLLKRLDLCLRLERQLAGQAGGAAAPAAREEWDALPPASTDIERALAARFEADAAALDQQDAAYATKLGEALPLLMRELLRAEVQLGIDSPPAFARDRLKVQVEVLQSSLKAGEKPLSPHSLALRLVQTAAALDEQAQARLRVVLGRLA